MIKWFIGVGSIFLLFLIGSYFFIPRKIIVTKSITANSNQAGVYRFLNDESNWTKWWPGSSFVNKRPATVFEAGGYRFKKIKPLYNSFEIAIEKGSNAENSLLNIFSLSSDSIKIEWNTILDAGTNPFSKIRHYIISRELSKSLGVVLTALKKYISNVKHVYGIDIRKEKVKIEFLVSTKKTFDHYPNTEDIYEMIDQLKKHIIREQAKEDDYPMLHINLSDSTHFEAQVAIPVNKKLIDTSFFSSKRMLKNGNILVAEITGGRNITDSAMKQVEVFVSDHQYRNIALPFESMVTDRMKERDSAKWVTRLYYPIM